MTRVRKVGGRLDNPADWVRLEVQAALNRGVPLVPVLVDGARMPKAAELPRSIKKLAYKNAVELSHTRWNHDVGRLLNSLKRREGVTSSRDDSPRPPVMTRTRSWT